MEVRPSSDARSEMLTPPPPALETPSPSSSPTSTTTTSTSTHSPQQTAIAATSSSSSAAATAAVSPSSAATAAITAIHAQAAAAAHWVCSNGGDMPTAYAYAMATYQHLNLAAHIEGDGNAETATLTADGTPCSAAQLYAHYMSLAYAQAAAAQAEAAKAATKSTLPVAIPATVTATALDATPATVLPPSASKTAVAAAAATASAVTQAAPTKTPFPFTPRALPTTDPCPSPSLDSIDFSKGVTRCLCGQMEESGVMVCCETCLVWQHAVCVGINETDLTDSYEYYCELCMPDHPLHVGRELIVRRKEDEYRRLRHLKQARQKQRQNELTRMRRAKKRRRAARKSAQKKKRANSTSQVSSESDNSSSEHSDDDEHDTNDNTNNHNTHHHDMNDGSSTPSSSSFLHHHRDNSESSTDSTLRELESMFKSEIDSDLFDSSDDSDMDHQMTQQQTQRQSHHRHRTEKNHNTLSRAMEDIEVANNVHHLHHHGGHADDHDSISRALTERTITPLEKDAMAAIMAISPAPTPKQQLPTPLLTTSNSLASSTRHRHGASSSLATDVNRFSFLVESPSSTRYSSLPTLSLLSPHTLSHRSPLSLSPMHTPPLTTSHLSSLTKERKIANIASLIQTIEHLEKRSTPRRATPISLSPHTITDRMMTLSSPRHPLTALADEAGSRFASPRINVLGNTGSALASGTLSGVLSGRSTLSNSSPTPSATTPINLIAT